MALTWEQATEARDLNAEAERITGKRLDGNQRGRRCPHCKYVLVVDIDTSEGMPPAATGYCENCETQTTWRIVWWPEWEFAEVVEEN